MKTTGIIIAAAAIIGATNTANAYQYNNGRWGMRLTGYGVAGMMEPEFNNAPVFIGDWSVRGQLNYAPAAGQTIAAIYSINQLSIDRNEYAHDAFLLWENRDYGRMEIGMTDSVAEKLGLGLPDVGALRINDNGLFYKKIHPHGPVVADTTIDSGNQVLRINAVSIPTNGVQYGLSAVAIGEDYNYAIDAGMKIRMPNGKIKNAMSFGASFMDAPHGFHHDMYAPAVYADWRGQFSAGYNLQYNSWIWGLTLRAIYDQNPRQTANMRVSDGIAAGTGISYDLLNYSVSLSYLFSDTGIWHSDAKKYDDHTVIASFRYKYSQNVDGWVSVGMTTETPFMSAGIRLNF